MSTARLEQKELIVGDSPFGLADKDAKFARWDARKALRGSSRLGWTSRTADLFEGSTNDVLLDRMRRLYTAIAESEASGLTRDQLLKNVLTEDPEINHYAFLLNKAPWGSRLYRAIYREHYQQDESGILWNDFVMSRIHRALDGTMERSVRMDGRPCYTIEAERDVLHFSPVNNLQQTSPVVDIYGNRTDERKQYGWSTDQRLNISFVNVSRVVVCEREGDVQFFKTFPGEEVFLTYRQEAVGSTQQIELKSLSADGSILF